MSDQFLKTREETQTWLDVMGIASYTIHDDLTVGVNGGVDISYKKLTHIPVQFGVVLGDFDCAGNNLTSLTGSPKKCESFLGGWNQLTSLAGAPDICVSFTCDMNQLTSLIGGPTVCSLLFSCDGNQLTSLVGLPYQCHVVWCMDNCLTSLDGAPAVCERIYCSRGNPDLYDISAAPDGCHVHYDHSAIARNRATRQLAALNADAVPDRTLKPKPGRIL